jgi:hypothetical protein
MSSGGMLLNSILAAHIDYNHVAQYSIPKPIMLHSGIIYRSVECLDIYANFGIWDWRGDNVSSYLDMIDINGIKLPTRLCGGAIGTELRWYWDEVLHRPERDEHGCLRPAIIRADGSKSYYFNGYECYRNLNV